MRLEDANGLSGLDEERFVVLERGERSHDGLERRPDLKAPDVFADVPMPLIALERLDKLVSIVEFVRPALGALDL